MGGCCPSSASEDDARLREKADGTGEQREGRRHPRKLDRYAGAAGARPRKRKGRGAKKVSRAKAAATKESTSKGGAAGRSSGRTVNALNPARKSVLERVKDRDGSLVVQLRQKPHRKVLSRASLEALRRKGTDAAPPKDPAPETSSCNNSSPHWKAGKSTPAIGIQKGAKTSPKLGTQMSVVESASSGGSGNAS